MADRFLDYKRGLNDVFVMEVPLIAAEAVADVDKVSQAARMRGQTMAAPWIKETGWTFHVREGQVLQALRRERLYFLAMTVLTGVWDPAVRRQLASDELRQRQLHELTLLNFAARTNQGETLRFSPASSFCCLAGPCLKCGPLPQSCNPPQTKPTDQQTSAAPLETSQLGRS